MRPFSLNENERFFAAFFFFNYIPYSIENKLILRQWHARVAFVLRLDTVAANSIETLIAPAFSLRL